MLYIDEFKRFHDNSQGSSFMKKYIGIETVTDGIDFYMTFWVVHQP